LSANPRSLNRLEQVLARFTRMRSGEGRVVALFFLQAFLLLFSYYLVKALREAFMLTEFDAEVRSYAVAVIALVLMVLVPVYGRVRRLVDGVGLVRLVTAFFAANLLVFCGLAVLEVRFGFVFFVWVGIYGLMIVAQFWAFAADSVNVKTGQRLFPLIMIGGNLGALVGAKVAELTVAQLTEAGLMLAATAGLGVAQLLWSPARHAVPEGSRSLTLERQDRVPPNLLGGLAMIVRDRYLLLIALIVVLLNWVNSTGEFILADAVVVHVEEQMADSGGTLHRSDLITAFYGRFQFWFTLTGFLIQLLLVSRIYRVIGIHGALAAVPIVAAFGYGLIAFVPVFAVIQVVKVLDNSIDYSLMNTTRHALFLPVSRAAKYDGKTAIDTFCWRFGDLVQAAAIFAGIHWFGLQSIQFAVLNSILALAWLCLAIFAGRRFRRIGQVRSFMGAPRLVHPLADVLVRPGHALKFPIPQNTFTDPDPGDVIELSVRREDGGRLPSWLLFDRRRWELSGMPPPGFEELRLRLVATDVDGHEAGHSFVLRRSR